MLQAVHETFSRTPASADRPRNRLLALMAEEDFALLKPHLEVEAFGKGAILAEPNAPILDVYFPESAVISMVARSPEGLEAEAGIVGREGFASTALLMGAETTTDRLQIQLPGAVARIAKAPFTAAVDASPGLRRLLMRFVQTLIIQSSRTVLSNAVHQIDERLARWIRMIDDRCDGGEFPLTHEFMSVMLAVRRPSVTTALHILEGNGLIRAERGCVIVRDRGRLEQFAGDSYGAPEDAYRQLIGEMRPSPNPG